MIVGGYQISNALVAILVVASAAGTGVATDSFSAVSDFDMPLSGPSDNVTQQNTTDDGSDSSDGSDGSDSSDSSDQDQSDSDSSDSSGSDDGTEDSSDSSSNDGEDSSDSDDGFLGGIIGGDEDQNETEDESQEEQTDGSSNETDNQDTTNETDETLPGENETESTVEISQLEHPKSAEFEGSYDSANVPLEIVLTGENAQYEITVDGSTEASGELSGEVEINRTMELSNTGLHDLKIMITRSGETLKELTRTFEIADGAIQQTGFERTGSVTTGSDTTFRLWDNGEVVSDATVYLGDTQKQTDQNGEVTFTIPYQQNITLSTDYSGIQDKTFEVTQDIPEPEITLTGPVDEDSFDTPTGTNTEVTFEASIDITEDSGTASLIIDGSGAYTQELSSGENTISTTQSISSGTHNWQINVSTPEYDTSSNSRSFTVNEVEVQNGLSLQSDPVAEEYNYVRLYNNGEPVQGTQITVNGDNKGTTNEQGEVGFNVPNAQEITVSASGYDSITRTVDGYEEVNTPLIYSASIQNPSSGEVQKPFTFEATVDSGLADSYEVKNSNQVFALGGLTENTTNTISESISPQNGEQTLELVLTSSENGNSTSRSVQVDVWETIQINNPSAGESFSNNEIDFQFSLDDSKSGSYSILLDGVTKYQSDLNSSKTGYSQDLLVSDSGTHQIEVAVDTGGQSYTRSTQFSVENSVETGLDVIRPTQGAVVKSPRFVYNVTYPAHYWTALDIAGSVIQENEYYSSRQISTTYDSLSYGDSSWEPLVRDEKSSQEGLSSGSLSFTYVNIERVSPTGGTGVYSSPIDFEFDIETGTNTRAILYVDGQQITTKSLSSGQNTLSESVDLNSGEHTFTLEVEDTGSGKSAQQEGVFEVS